MAWREAGIETCTITSIKMKWRRNRWMVMKRKEKRKDNCGTIPAWFQMNWTLADYFWLFIPSSVSEHFSRNCACQDHVRMRKLAALAIQAMPYVLHAKIRFCLTFWLFLGEKHEFDLLWSEAQGKENQRCLVHGSLVGSELTHVLGSTPPTFPPSQPLIAIRNHT